MSSENNRLLILKLKRGNETGNSISHLYLNYLLLHRKISGMFQKSVHCCSASNGPFHHPHCFGHSWRRVNVWQIVVRLAMDKFGRNLNHRQSSLFSDAFFLPWWTNSSIQSPIVVTLSNWNRMTLNLGLVENDTGRSRYLIRSSKRDFFCRYSAPYTPTYEFCSI